jgi:hypothetical protein
LHQQQQPQMQSSLLNNNSISNNSNNSVIEDKSMNYDITINIAAIDNGLAFPFKHPDEWRACKYNEIEKTRKIS